MVMVCIFFFFQAEDGIRDLVRSRGLGDVYKRQGQVRLHGRVAGDALLIALVRGLVVVEHQFDEPVLSLIHI